MSGTYVSNDGLVSGWYQYWGIYPPICGACEDCGGAWLWGVIWGGLWSPIFGLPDPKTPLFGPFQWGGGFCSHGTACDGGLKPWIK